MIDIMQVMAQTALSYLAAFGFLFAFFAAMGAGLIAIAQALYKIGGDK